MISIDDKRDCVGCGACFNICPVKAIEMKIDEEGFYYPSINLDRCTKCHLCEKVCPTKICALQRTISFSNSYVLINKDFSIRAQSSSGGVFYELARVCIANNGCVYGVAFDESYLTKHIAVENQKDISLLMGSKYLQSPSFLIFKEIKHKLLNCECKEVLFSGTPCQIAGLKAYLGKDYNHLYCVEICCHAVPSPKAWLLYLSQFKHSKIGSISFRSKAFGWRHYGLNLKNEKGDNIVLEPKEKNTYMKGFLHSVFNRPSCSKCPHKPLKSNADIIIGDFWGIDINHSDLNDNKGASLLIPLTEKGYILFNKIKNCFNVNQVDPTDILAVNGNFSRSEKEHPRKKMFWNLVNEKGASFDNALKKCLHISFFSRIKRKIKATLTK